MTPIEVRAQLQQRDVFRVAAFVFLRHSVSIMLMAAGPVLWLTGVIGSSPEVTRVGAGLVPVAIAVVAVAFIQGTYGAYRPGIGDLYEPVEWTFGEDGIDIVQPSRRARAEWSEFRSWRRVAGCYLLAVTRTKYLIVPMRDVPDAERSRFEELLTSKLGARRG